MSSLTFFVLVTLFGPMPCESVIEGRVLDAHSGKPLNRARVDAGEASTPTRTNPDGKYRLSGLCAGPIQLRVVRRGYELRTINVRLKENKKMDIALSSVHVFQGEDIRVHAPRLKKSDTRSVVSLQGDDLLKTRGENLADALANLPGVTVLRSGTTAKPVVRGQYGTRVLKLYDGVRHEGQDWGLDHGPEIDPFAAGTMRVVKGSAGVRYGPDAIAGVLLIEPPELLEKPGVTIRADTIGALNGKRGTVAARIDGNHSSLPGLSWRLDGNYSRGAGLETPDYPLDNTGLEEKNIGGILKYQGDCWSLKLSYRRNDKRSGVCLCVRNEATSDFDAILSRTRPINSELYRADYEIDRPFQWVKHDIAVARGQLDFKGVGELETTYAYQLNDRNEFDIVRVETSAPQYTFTLRSHTADLTFKHVPVALGQSKRLEGVAGVSGMFQDNFYVGRPLLSNYRSLSGGVFAIERLVLGRVELEVGARYDQETRASYIPKKTYQSLIREGRIDQDFCETRENNSRCKSDFNAGTLSFGSLVRVTPDVSAKLDLSSATRMPTIEEQYINGTAPSFPIMARGRADLGPETSWSLSGTLEANLSWLSAELSVYGSYIDDYIYLSPELRDDGTVRTDVLINGRFPRFSYDAINAIFYGVDANAKMRLGQFDLAIQGSAVRATRSDNGEFLLFIPSDRIRTELTYRLPENATVKDSYLAVDSQFIARQSNVSPQSDFAPVPDGYVLLGARVGTSFKWAGQRYTLDLEVQNALNTAYRDYTSMLRYYADEPGMQAFLRLGADLSL